MARLLKAPGQRLGSAIFSQTTSTPSLSVSFITSAARSCSIVHAEVGAVFHGYCHTLVSAGRGDHLGAAHLRHLNAAAAERARGAHDEHPFARLNSGFAREQVERHRKVTGDHGSLGKAQVVCDSERIPLRHRDVFGISTPAMQPDMLAREAIGFQTSQALACTSSKA